MTWKLRRFKSSAPLSDLTSKISNKMSTVLTNDSSVTGIQCMHTSLSLAYSHTSAVDKVGSLHSDTLGNWSYQGIKHKFILWGEKVKRESTFDLHENGGSLFKNASEMCVT